MRLIDSHCHIDFAIFDDDRATILARCQQLGITDLILPATTAKRWQNLLDLCQNTAMLHPALGMHPMFMEQHQSSDISLLADYITTNAVVAIGEIGLDFYDHGHDKTAQIELVSAQLALAQQNQLPVILHVRKAHDQMLQLLKRFSINQGIVHAFTGSEQQAHNYIKQGLCLGIGGVISYPRAKRLRQMVSELPEHALVLETDAPDMPLSGQQGQRNSPENIALIAQTVSELRQQSLDDVAAFTTQNCQRLFNL